MNNWKCDICGEVANYNDCGTFYCREHWRTEVIEKERNNAKRVRKKAEERSQ